jgi:hypothetical protein
MVTEIKNSDGNMASNQSTASKEGSSSCPLGFSCKKAHSKYERLYHPLRYKTDPCDVYEQKPLAQKQKIPVEE